MTAGTCPDSAHCPVPDPKAVDLRRLRTYALALGATFHTSYRRSHWPSIFNGSGAGDARFSPLRARAGSIVPTLYGAATRSVALLETAFHEVHAGGARIISEAVDLRPRGLVTLHAPDRFLLVDLRDAELARLGLERSELVSALPLHYRCTREWGEALHARKRIGSVTPVGLLWQSRTAELAQSDSRLLADLLAGQPSEVFVLFGDRLSTDVDDYEQSDRFDDLTAGIARELVHQIANQIHARIVA